MLGALAAAGAVVWNAPQPGWRTREQIMEAVEGVLFRVLDFPETMSGLRASDPAPSIDTLAAERLVGAATPAAPAFVPPDAAALAVDGAAVEPAGERDIVIDGPRPSEMAR